MPLWAWAIVAVALAVFVGTIITWLAADARSRRETAEVYRLMRADTSRLARRVGLTNH